MQPNVIVHLLAAQSAIGEAIKILSSEGKIELPKGVEIPAGACPHKNMQVAMGGYWSCPDCGEEGRN